MSSVFGMGRSTNCRLKALITLKEVNTSDVETRKNVHEQNFDDEVKNNKQIVVNLPLPFNGEEMYEQTVI